MASPTHPANARHTDNWWLEDISLSLAAGAASGGQYNSTPPTVTDGASVPLQTDVNGNSKVVGNAASGATDSGNPVKVGGRFNTTKPTLTDGQRGDVQLSSSGSLIFVPKSSSAQAGGDGFNNSTNVLVDDLGNGLTLPTRPSVYNGATWDRLRGNTNGMYGQGNVAAGVTDAGNPLKIAGVYNTSPPIYTNGQRGDVQIDTRGSLVTQLASGGALITGFDDNSDAQANVGTPTRLGVIGRNYLYNGTNWDRVRNNEAVTLLASAARTTTQTSADLVNYNGASFLDIIVDTTVFGTGSVTMTVNAKDPASGKYYPLLSGAAIVATGTLVYRVGVGLTAAANAIANLPVPRIFQIVMTANNANSQTYSVGYNLMRQ